MEETLISSAEPAEQDVANTYMKSIKDIPISWVADHAKHVCITIFIIHYIIQ